MRSHRWNPLLILVVALSSILVTDRGNRADAATSVSISVSYFYDSLSPYGHWVEYPRYGRCWVPEVEADWRPYSDGYWEYTDYGWTWVDYEPWGWAVSHYGRWTYDPIYGWVWLPGTQWAPAWVAWHYSDDWVGWAPLPPYGAWQSASFSYSSVSIERIPARDWCFVPSRRLFDRRLSFVSRDRNITLLAQTRNATRFSQRDGRALNLGIDVRQFERATGRNVTRMRALNAGSPRGGRGQRVGNDGIALFRPTVNRGGNERPISTRDRQWANERRDQGRSNRSNVVQRPRPERGAANPLVRNRETGRPNFDRTGGRERPARPERNPRIERERSGPERGATFQERPRYEPRPRQERRMNEGRGRPARAQEFQPPVERRVRDERPQVERRGPQPQERGARERPQVERGPRERPQVERGARERPQVERGRPDRSPDQPDRRDAPTEERKDRGQGRGHGKRSD